MFTCSNSARCLVFHRNTTANPYLIFLFRTSGGRSTGLIACMSIVSQAFPNWQLGARSSQAAMDALYFITTIQQQNPNAKTFVYAQGLGSLVANQMAAALPTATWPSAPRAKVDGWILDSVRCFPSQTNLFFLVNPFLPHHITLARRSCIPPTTPPSGFSAPTL